MAFRIANRPEINYNALVAHFALLGTGNPLMNLIFDGSQAQKEIMNKRGEPLKYHIRYENMAARLLALKQSGVEGYHLKIRNATRRKTKGK